MSIGAIVAKESHLGRSKSSTEITRPSLMKELRERRIRITAQRRLLVERLRIRLDIWTRPPCWKLPKHAIPISIAPPSIARSHYSKIAD